MDAALITVMQIHLSEPEGDILLFLTGMNLLVQANDVREAYDNTLHVMQSTMGEYSIPAVSESPIMDVFPYFSGEEGETEMLERFNALKASKTVKADEEIVDHMEFETAAEE